MAVRTVTSDPQPSKRVNGYYYFYFNKKLSNGGECLALIHPSLKDYIKKGFIFDDDAVHFSPEFGASILSLNVDEEADEDTSLASDPETGWGDPDDLIATCSEPPPQAITPARSSRAATARRRNSIHLDPEFSSVPAPLMKTGIQIARLFLMQYKLLGTSINEPTRAVIAQRLTAYALIHSTRPIDSPLSAEDTQLLTSL